MEYPQIVDLGDTHRLLIRHPRGIDLEPIVALWTDPDVTYHLGGPRDGAMVEDFFQQYATDPQAVLEEELELWWSIIEQKSGEFVGLNSILEKDVDGETVFDLGYFLLPSFWGKGYATEASWQVIQYAFGKLDLASLVAIIDPRNIASQSVALKLGMKLEREVPRSDGVTRQIYRLEKVEWKPDSV
jgi:ribosomal-protein-alanine N-acetyltransferase